MALLRRYRQIAVWLPLLLGFWSIQAAEVAEYQLKGAFLYNFLRFVEWPESAFEDSKSPYVIGIIGQDPFGTALDQMVSGKKVSGRPVIVRRVTDQELSQVHVLFVSSSERRRYGALLARVKSRPVLTVGETDDFTRAGGIVNFFMEGRKLRFQIDAASVEGTGLKIDSSLLNLAKLVRD